MPIVTREVVFKFEVAIESSKAAIDIDAVVTSMIDGIKSEVDTLEFDQDYGGILTVRVGNVDVFDPLRGRSVHMAGRKRRL